ncbi:NrsF family protein [Rhodopila sp.]|uniref:NrsF family protein n=1 Tax=Rhodopila sp. TaxID=2480087 RepID=UPI003D0E2F75
MPNDRLIDRLVSELKPVSRRTVGRDALILVALCMIELALFLASGAMRPDMPAAMHLPSFWWKLGSLGLIASVGGGIAVVSLDPVQSPRRGLRWLVAAVAMCLAIGWVIDAEHREMPTLAARVNWHAGLECVYQMVLLSVPAVVGLGLLMRRGAPTDKAGTALAVGIAAAAWGAFVFVFACPHDDPLYIAIWYCVGCGLVTGFARLVLPRLTRW